MTRNDLIKLLGQYGIYDSALVRIMNAVEAYTAAEVQKSLQDLTKNKKGVV